MGATASAVATVALRAGVGVVAHGDELLLKRLRDLGHARRELRTLLVGQAVEDVLRLVHLVQVGGGLLAGLGQADHHHAAVLLGLGARDEALLLELGKKLRQGLLTHVKQEAELLLAGLGLGLEQREQTALATQGIAEAAVRLGLVLGVTVEQAAHAGDLVGEGSLIRGLVVGVLLVCGSVLRAVLCLVRLVCGGIRELHARLVECLVVGLELVLVVLEFVVLGHS